MVLVCLEVSGKFLVRREFSIQVCTITQYGISDSALVYANSLFQVRLSGVRNCSQWIVSKIKFT